MISAWDKIPEEIKTKYEGLFPVPVVSIGKDLGLKIYYTDTFPDSKSGSISKEGDEYIIYVNSKHPITRQRFSIAHEIGHYMLHDDAFEGDKELVTDFKNTLEVNEENKTLDRANKNYKSGKNWKMEKEANEFAADLLMPETAFVGTFETAKDAEEVASKFQVSTSAVAVRASKLLGQFFM